MKLLILSSNNGQGHNSASKALIECAESRGNTAIMIDNMLFQSPAMSELIEKVYIRGALHAPKLVGTSNKLAGLIEEAGILPQDTPAGERDARRLARFIRDNGFDAVLATHIFAAQLLTHLEDEERSKIKTAFLATDYSYTAFTSDTFLDAYFLPHRQLLEKYEELAPGRNYVVTGIPTSAKKMAHMDKSAARAQLGLPDGVPIAVVMTGSMGFGDVVPLVQRLIDTAAPDTLILVLYGSNHKLAETLAEDFPDGGRVRPVGYTDKVGVYLDAADVLISKPGGLSSTEAAVKEIPLVHTNPVPGWEEDNVRFFTALGLSRTGASAAQQADAAVELLADEEAARLMRQAQHSQINKNAAGDILDALERLRK